jgi:hypothetical protein
MSSWQKNYSKKKYFINNNLKTNIENNISYTTSIKPVNIMSLDEIIQLIKSYGFRYEIINNIVPNAMGIGDLLWNINHLQNNIWSVPLFFNVYLFLFNSYYPNPKNALEFRLILLNDILSNHSTLKKSDIIFYFNENKYHIYNNKFQYDKISSFALNLNINFPKYPINDYIIFHTKLRLFTHNIPNDYSSVKTQIQNFCKSFKCKYKIIILGERYMASSLESKMLGITTIYNELLSLSIHNNIIDLSEGNIYDNLNYDNFKKDIGIIKDAKYNIHIGIGGQFSFSLLFSGNIIHYCKDLHNDSDIRNIAYNSNLKNYNGFSEFTKFEKYMNENLSENLIVSSSINNEYIRYISGGKLGDFIFQLSIIQNNYIKTGKKGILYIANIGDNFVKGLDIAYNDTKDFILKQEYIKDYKIYNNELYDINLSSWRDTVHMKEQNWFELFRNTFNIEFGLIQWINNIPIKLELENKILIGFSLIRDNKNINMKELLSKYDETELHFVCLDENEYINFKNKTGMNISYTRCKDIFELTILINSCKMYIGNFSAPLCIAIALYKKCIGITPTGFILDKILIKDAPKYWPHLFLIY